MRARRDGAVCCKRGTGAKAPHVTSSNAAALGTRPPRRIMLRRAGRQGRQHSRSRLVEPVDANALRARPQLPSVSALFKLRAGVVSFLASPPRPCARRASRTNACAWRRELSLGVAVDDRAAVVDQREVELGGDLPRLEVRSPRPGETRACTRTICRSSRRRPRCARGRRRRRRACRRSRKAPSCTGFFVYSGAFRNLVRLAQQRLRVGALVLVAELLVAKMKSWGSPELNSCAPGGTASAASRVTI